VHRSQNANECFLREICWVFGGAKSCAQSPDHWLCFSNQLGQRRVISFSRCFEQGYQGISEGHTPIMA
jgi:hypothetical protein